MHNIMFSELPGNLTLEEVNDWVLRAVATNGDRYGTERVTAPHAGVFADYSEADKWLQKYMRSQSSDWYSGYAVKYKAYTYTATEKSDELAKKRDDLFKEQYEYEKASGVKNSRKSQFIGCPVCGSKINREKLGERNCCPVCWAELRSKSVLERIESYKKRVERIDKQSRNAMKKKFTGEEWLVKWEYHS